MRHSVTVEICSDMVCPWCAIGKRLFDAATFAEVLRRVVATRGAHV